MKTSILTAVFILAAGLAACKKRAPENIPQPKTEDAVETAAVSTGAAKTAGLLEAPGAYLKTTVGQVGKARAAAALFEKTARQEADSLDLGKAGGN